MPYEPPSYEPPPPPVWLAGLDLGMMSDYTALALLEKQTVVVEGKSEDEGETRYYTYQVRHLQRWMNVDYPTIAEKLREMFARLKTPPWLIADETGVGVGVLQILRRAKLRVQRVVGISITAGHQVNH